MSPEGRAVTRRPGEAEADVATRERGSEMTERELKKKPSPERTDGAVEEVEATASAAATATGDKLKAELDDLLDEIDEVLEDNAEEFVRNYVQKGGE